jgi:hypothetical protein
MRDEYMDAKEKLTTLLEALRVWHGAVLDFGLSEELDEYRTALDTAEVALMKAHSEYWAATQPSAPEPVKCLECEVAWNAREPAGDAAQGEPS